MDEKELAFSLHRGFPAESLSDPNILPHYSLFEFKKLCEPSPPSRAELNEYLLDMIQDGSLGNVAQTLS